MNPLRCLMALTFALGVTTLFATPLMAQAPAAVGVGANFFFEDSELSGEEQGSVQVTDESFDYRSEGFLSGSLYVLAPWSERFRIGGGIHYYGKYVAEQIPEGGLEEDEDPETVEFGTLVEMRARAEYLIPAGVFQLALGAHVGIPVLFPNGEFQDEIERLQDQQASVWSVPRIGFLVGPQVSALYRYNEHLNFRLDFGVFWKRLFLFNTSQEVQGIPFKKTWTAKVLRTEISLGLEVDL